MRRLIPIEQGRFKPRFRYNWRHGSWLPHGTRRSRLDRLVPYGSQWRRIRVT